MATNGKTELPVRTRGLRDVDEMFRAWRADPFRLRIPWALREAEAPAPAPAVDMFEREGNVVVKAEMPGIAPEKIEVSIADGELKISGEREEEHEVREENYYRSERTYGRIFRTLTLPEGIDASTAKATVHDGVLEVVVAKRAGATPTKVEVKAA